MEDDSSQRGSPVPKKVTFFPLTPRSLYSLFFMNYDVWCPVCWGGGGIG